MKRLAWIDAYKAFLIVLVVLGHSFQHLANDFDGNIVVKLIYSHHMAAFFLLSGIVTWRPEFKFRSLGKKLCALLLPFFLWWLIPFLCGGAHDFTGSFLGLLCAPDSGLWFLYVLAACHTLNFVAIELSNRLHLNADLGILLAGGVLRPLR